MDDARLSRFPHLSWFAFPVSGSPSRAPLVVNLHSVCHASSLTLSGNHAVRWISHGRETRWSEQPKTLHLGGKGASHQNWAICRFLQIWWLAPFPRGHALGNNRG